MEINDVYVSETLEALERGGMVKDYNSNSTNLDSEDEEDPRTPASVSSQVLGLIKRQSLDNKNDLNSGDLCPVLWYTRDVMPDGGRKYSLQLITRVKCFVFSLISQYFCLTRQFLLQGSQGYGSTESDFVDMETFPSLQNTDTSSLPELNLVGQVCHTFILELMLI